MTIYYKAVRTDGTSFHDRSVRWLPEGGVIPEGGVVVHHPDDGGGAMDHASGYLSVSVEPADCTGFAWPCRLLRVVPVDGKPVSTPEPAALPHKRAAQAWRVVEELDPFLALGTNGAALAELLAEMRTLTDTAWSAARVATRDAAWVAAWDAARVATRDAAWVAAWDAARDAARVAARVAAWDAARVAAWNAARDATRDAARDAAWDAALATLVRDRITPDQYTRLMAPIEAARALIAKEATEKDKS